MFSFRFAGRVLGLIFSVWVFVLFQVLAWSAHGGGVDGHCVPSVDSRTLPPCAPPPSLAPATSQLLSEDCTLLGSGSGSGRFDLCTDGTCVPSGQSCTGWCDHVRLVRFH